MELLRLPGRLFLELAYYMGQIGALLGELFIAVRTGAWRLRLIAQQIVSIGYGSQAVVVVTGAFTGYTVEAGDEVGHGRTPRSD